MNFNQDADEATAAAGKQSPGRKSFGYRAIFPKLLGDQVMTGRMDGLDHYGHWKLFRQSRAMGTERQQLVISHMKRGLRHRLDRRPADEHESLESDRSTGLFQRYSQYGVQRSNSTLSTAGVIPVDFLHPETESTPPAAGPATLAADPQQDEKVKSLLDKELTFVNTFAVASELEEVLSRQSSSMTALPPIGARTRDDAKTLLLYVTSSLGDFDAERAAMAEHLVPHLRDTARSFGLDFRLIDPHFGCRFHACDNHEDMKICQEALAKTKLYKDRLNHVILLGDKFGKPSSPPTIDRAEFELIRGEYNSAYQKLQQLRVERQKELEEMETERKVQEEKRNRAGADDDDTDDDFEDASTRRNNRRTSVNRRRSSVKPKPKASLTSVAKTVGRAMLIRKSQLEDNIRSIEPYLPSENFLDTWYYLDSSRVPVVYRLAQVSSVLPEFSAYRMQVQDQWQRTDQQLLATLTFCSRRLVKNDVMPESESTILALNKSSVLEQELRQTVLRSRGSHSDTLMFVRTFDNLKDQVGQPLAALYTDIEPGRDEVDLEAAHAFFTVKRDLELMVPEDIIHRAQISWIPEGGVNPERSRIHENHVKKICAQIIRVLEPQIRQIGLDLERHQTEQQSLMHTIQENENYCLQHAAECYGRKTMLAKMKAYLNSDSMIPMVVHGPSGSGKTTLMAKCFSKLKDWLPESSTCVVRVVGVSSRSGNVRYLLGSICRELLLKWKEQGHPPQDFAGLVNEFTARLQQASRDRPLVILLDSLGQLTEEYQGRRCHWLPKVLPKYVKVIASTVGDERVGVLGQLKSMYSDASPDHFMEMEQLTVEEAEKILSSWLAKEGKTLTTPQLEHVLSAFNCVPLPLQLRLSFHESLNWPPSFLPREFAAKTLKQSVTFYLSRLESGFGDLLVKRALGYLTAAKNGLTEAELLDILSLDDHVMDVLNFQFHLPVRRCPPIAWLRLRNALGEFLTEKSVDNCVTIVWAFNMFKEAAAERYLNQKEKPVLHKALAEYFDGMWAGNKRKPHLGNEAGSNRFRQLSAVLLRTACATLISFWPKMLASSVRHVLDLYESVLSAEPRDKDLRLISNSLYLSRAELELDPKQLASQLLGRITDVIKADRPKAPADPKKYPFVHALFYRARRNNSCMTTPSEIVLDLLQGHRLPITAVCISEDGTTGFTSSQEDTIKVWDLTNSRVVSTIEGSGSQVLSMTLGRQESVLITSELTCVKVYAVKQGCLLFTIPVQDDPCSIVVNGDTNNLVCFHQGICVMRTWNLERLTKVCDKTLTETGLHQDRTVVVSTRCNADLVLYGLRGSNFARVVHCRSGQDVLKLSCLDKASLVTAVQTSREYYIVACQATDLHTRVHMFFLELFDTGKGKSVRRIKGCSSDNVVDELMLTNIQAARISSIGAVYDFRRVITGSLAENALRMWNVQQNMQSAPQKTESLVNLADIVIDAGNNRYALTKLSDNSVIHAWSLSANKFSGKVVKSAKSIAGPNDMVLMDRHFVIVLARPGFSPKVPNAKFVYQTLTIFDIQKQKFTVNLNNVLIVPCAYEEYHVIHGNQLLCMNEFHTNFLVYSLESGEIIRRIKPEFSFDPNKKRPSALLEGSVLQRENEMFEEFINSRKQTVFMTPWERRNESKSAKTRRYRSEWEEKKQRADELEQEKGNGIADFLISKDQSTVVSSFFAHHICVFNLSNGTQQSVLEHPNALLHLFTASLSPNGRYLAHTIYNEQQEMSQLCLWDCRTGKVKKSFNEGGVGAVAVNSDASILVYGTDRGELQVRDCRRSPAKVRVARTSACVNFQQSSHRNFIQLFRDDKWALIYARSLSVWNMQSLEMLSILTPDQPLHSIRLALNDQLIVFSSKDSNDPIILKMLSANSKRPQRVGARKFGEADSTDSSEDEDMPVERSADD
uniref:WD_REPEATS_REGION domain-containing protein n=1 Tax=Macrostomum lignano TaxID=282301 RepID=A0A1I8GHY8_9PLAT